MLCLRAGEGRMPKRGCPQGSSSQPATSQQQQASKGPCGVGPQGRRLARSKPVFQSCDVRCRACTHCPLMKGIAHERRPAATCCGASSLPLAFACVTAAPRSSQAASAKKHAPAASSAQPAWALNKQPTSPSVSHLQVSVWLPLLPYFLSCRFRFSVIEE